MSETEKTTRPPTRALLWGALGIGAVVLAFAAMTGLKTPLPESGSAITVYKSPACGCCTLWVNQLEAGGLDVEVVDVESTASIRSRLNVPDSARSCHTAKVGDYWVEGHVPVDLVVHLLNDKPADIKGIAVPGMVIGSPGMEGPNPVDYDVIAYDADGNARVLERREGKSHVE